MLQLAQYLNINIIYNDVALSQFNEITQGTDNWYYVYES